MDFVKILESFEEATKSTTFDVEFSKMQFKQTDIELFKMNTSSSIFTLTTITPLG
ncbi:hypothetical protein [Flagellimonas flava]|uniref:Uncharacterized protein n=1 Tax=Flagellimonas flava TaxID=570519 RepID=A0A1M5P6V3_9FLAO|nr:hypothetical protein [Allomuricauda flava]SHG97534.1 hypothetical protein SAMN04488116_3104 [Allomuricauda flava]